MRKSENFDLNLYEGTDIFNPLTTDVPNYEKIDAQMEKIYNLSVGKATELKTGTVHALTRENADCPMIHFTATSNFTSNDTFTVDGVQVSALLVDGSTLPTNCYIIGSEVICYLKGTLLTFFLSGSVSKDSEKLGGELPAYYSKQEDFEQLNTTVTSMGGIVEKNSDDIIKTNDSLDKYEYAYEYKTISSNLQVGSMKYGYIQFSFLYPDGYNFIESITPILNLPGQATVYDNGNSYNICVFNCTDTTRTYNVKVMIKYTKQK